MDRLLIDSFFRARLCRDAHRTAVKDYDTGAVYSYGDLAARSSRVACFLRERAGLAKGDRVAMLARNGVYFLDVLLALPRSGGILTSYNYMLRRQELMTLVLRERPRVFFYESLFSEKAEHFKEALPDTIFVSLDGDGAEEDLSYAAVLAEEGEMWDGVHSDLTLESIAMLLHTGGSTGLPKAAKISYRALMYNTIAQVFTFGMTYADRVYISFPLFHGGAWNYSLMLLAAGGTILYKRKFDAEETLRMVEKEQLTILAGSPSVFRRIADCKAFDATDFSGIRMIRCGSASPAVDLMERYWEKGLLFYNGYGTTEAGLGVLALPAAAMTQETFREKAGSVGKEMMFSQVRLVDEAGQDVACGQCGELLVRGALLFSGYWGCEEETEQAVRDGWFHTGDIAKKDQDGYYYICGRKKNMYISGGENIYPTEIEHVILCHPAVRDACVIGVEDFDWGEVGKAMVVLHEGAALTPNELRAFLRERLSTIKIPRDIQFVPDIPRNDAGKLEGTLVQERYG